jgi:endonuclease YncB( thermonuclease family)
MTRYLHILSAFGLALVAFPVYAEDLYGAVVPSAPSFGPMIEGEALVIDSGTISIRLQNVRFHGINALEYDQSCSDGWAGGIEATAFLSKLVACACSKVKKAEQV